MRHYIYYRWDIKNLQFSPTCGHILNTAHRNKKRLQFSLTSHISKFTLEATKLSTMEWHQPRRNRCVWKYCWVRITHFFFFSYACHKPQLVSHETPSSSTECSGDKPPISFVRGQDSTMWDIVWVLPQGHRSVSVSRHFLLQAPQCPCSVRKQLSRDHCCRSGDHC